MLVNVCRGPALFREIGFSVLVFTGIGERGAIALRLGLLEGDPIVGRMTIVAWFAF